MSEAVTGQTWGFNTDFISVIFLLSLNFVLLGGLMLYVYKTQDWRDKSIEKDVSDSFLNQLEDRWDQKARDAFFLDEENSEQETPLRSHHRD